LECAERGHQSIVRGNHPGLEPDGKRDVHRVVDRSAGDGRQRMRVLGQLSTRDGLNRRAPDVGDELAALRFRQLAATGFLPDRVGRLGEQEVGRDVLVRSVQQSTRRVAVNFGDEPLDDDAGVDDETLTGRRGRRESTRRCPSAQSG
jgi:hypothetical protein